MIDMASQGTKRAPAGEILGHSGLEISSVETGRLLMGMGVPNTKISGQKHYVLEGETLERIQIGLVQEAPTVIASIPDLDPVIKDLAGKLGYWRSQTDQVRQVKGEIAATQRELKALGYEHSWQISSWEQDLESQRHILEITKKEVAALDAVKQQIAELPRLDVVEQQLAALEQILEDRQSVNDRLRAAEDLAGPALRHQAQADEIENQIANLPAAGVIEQRLQSAQETLAERQGAIKVMCDAETAASGSGKKIEQRKEWERLRDLHGPDKVLKTLAKLDKSENPAERWWHRFLR